MNVSVVGHLLNGVDIAHVCLDGSCIREEDCQEITGFCFTMTCNFSCSNWSFLLIRKLTEIERF
jgi:hypothetical protein